MIIPRLCQRVSSPSKAIRRGGDGHRELTTIDTPCRVRGPVCCGIPVRDRVPVPVRGGAVRHACCRALHLVVARIDRELGEHPRISHELAGRAFLGALRRPSLVPDQTGEDGPGRGMISPLRALVAPSELGTDHWRSAHDCSRRPTRAIARVCAACWCRKDGALHCCRGSQLRVDVASSLTAPP